MIHTLEDCLVLDIQDEDGDTSHYEIAFDDEPDNFETQDLLEDF